MKKKIYYLIGFVILIFIIVIAMFLSFGRETTPATFSSSEIFTEDVYEKLMEIDYWNGDTKLIINNYADMKCFYSYLTSLKLKKASSIGRRKDGGLTIDLVMKNETISIGLLSGEIFINGKKYYIDKDICDSVRKIALKYMDYYNNDIFTKKLFEDLIEIDCWVDNENLVIDDAERLEEAYHYLSRLTLEEASPEYKLINEPLKINLVTEDATISFSVTSTAICINGKIYYTDSKRDIVQLITTIATENYK